MLEKNAVGIYIYAYPPFQADLITQVCLIFIYILLIYKVIEVR